MELATAISLIEKGIDPLMPYQTWADLGAGNGLFSQALGHLIGNEGIVYAIDKDSYVLNEIETIHQRASIIPMQKDFVADDIGLVNLHGVLMANSLHFIAGKAGLLKKLKSTLQHCGRLIIIEYDTTHPNQWVPFPIPFDDLKTLLTSLGFASVEKIAEQPSRYSAGSIYAAVAQMC